MRHPFPDNGTFGVRSSVGRAFVVNLTKKFLPSLLKLCSCNHCIHFCSSAHLDVPLTPERLRSKNFHQNESNYVALLLVQCGSTWMNLYITTVGKKWTLPRRNCQNNNNERNRKWNRKHNMIKVGIKFFNMSPKESILLVTFSMGTLHFVYYYSQVFYIPHPSFEPNFMILYFIIFLQ